MHSVGDIGAMVEWVQNQLDLGTDSTENLAVRHNQNEMVRQFGQSAWDRTDEHQFSLTIDPSDLPRETKCLGECYTLLFSSLSSNN